MSVFTNARDDFRYHLRMSPSRFARFSEYAIRRQGSSSYDGIYV